MTCSNNEVFEIMREIYIYILGFGELGLNPRELVLTHKFKNQVCFKIPGYQNHQLEALLTHVDMFT